MNLVFSILILSIYPLHTLEDVNKSTLLELGKSLTERLRHPAKQGTELLADLQAYIGELYGIYEKVSTRDGELIKEGVKEFDAINNAGGTPHFKMDVDFSLMKEKYYWTYDDRILHVKDLFNETEVLWNKLAERINYIRF